MEQSSNGTSGVYNKLSPAEKAQLIELASSPLMELIKKSVDVYQKDKAIFTIANSPNHETTLLNRGEISGARFIYDLAHYAVTKKERATAKNNAIALKEDLNK